MNDPEVTDLLREIANTLIRKHWKLATAESCTGGWIAKCCTDLAGSSAWFERGFVTYSNEAKMDIIGVSAEALETQGAVSRVVAEQMAEGARQAASVEAALAVTGIAGPDGGSVEKPVGTVWFAWSLEGADVESEHLLLDGDRQSVRARSVERALQGLQARLERR